MISISRPIIEDEERQAVLEVLETGQLAQGPRVAMLERRFAEQCCTKHAIAVSSGTAALHLALLAHGVGPGDEVITSPFSFVATASSIMMTGAKPLFADVREDDFCLDPASVRRLLSPRTRAIIGVHLFGQPFDVDAVSRCAADAGVPLIEDAAQAIGGRYGGRPVGSFGTGCFSLYATKNIMCGEGGIVTTNDGILDEQVRLLRSHGASQQYQHVRLGYNLRMNDLCAAIGVAQLAKLERFTCRRRENAAFLDARIQGTKLPRELPGRYHVYHQYTVRIERDRDGVAARLHHAGVGTGVFYRTPIHKQPFVREAVGDVSCPVAERLANEVLSLPVHPSVTDQELLQVVTALNGAVRGA